MGFTRRLVRSHKKNPKIMSNQLIGLPRHLLTLLLVAAVALGGCLPMDSIRTFELIGRFSDLPSGGSVTVKFDQQYDRLLDSLSGASDAGRSASRHPTVMPGGEVTADFSEPMGGFLTPFGVLVGSGLRPYFAVLLPETPGLAFIIGPGAIRGDYQLVRLSDRVVLQHSAAKWQLRDIAWENIDGGWRVHVRFVQAES